jgi:hypothetical protein
MTGQLCGPRSIWSGCQNIYRCSLAWARHLQQSVRSVHPGSSVSGWFPYVAVTVPSLLSRPFCSTGRISRLSVAARGSRLQPTRAQGPCFSSQSDNARCETSSYQLARELCTTWRSACRDVSVLPRAAPKGMPCRTLHSWRHIAQLTCTPPWVGAAQNVMDAARPAQMTRSLTGTKK